MQSDQCTYGSDKNGLVWGYLFKPEVPAIQIISDTAAEWIAAPVEKPENAFLWLHFSLSNLSSEPWIRRHFALPDAFYESFHEGLFGMNVEGIPLSTYKHGFIVIVGILTILTALIAYLAFGRRLE
ncbi:MAG: hypothetical protein C4518_00830 [Desulfobacteraceae bacterium]|nr:MAG: hypothetical protein C4518_00830 [Desulfobacteraceae bacterium]